MNESWLSGLLVFFGRYSQEQSNQGSRMKQTKRVCGMSEPAEMARWAHNPQTQPILLSRKTTIDFIHSSFHQSFVFAFHWIVVEFVLFMNEKIIITVS